ncbi:MAG: hypothetical protein IH899_05165, partial [Planctomycetes bacterium]|nr:hypothetical protein [Planctomycetota bacterium]
METMVFGFLKKKKQKTHLELPPPPEPPSEVDVRKLGDIEPIKPAAEPEEVTEIPKTPELAETPEIVPSDKTEPIPIPAPELPAFPEL